MHVIDFAPRMRPTRDLGKTRDAGLRLGLVELGEPCVAVGVQEPATACEQRSRMFGLAVRRVSIEGGGRRRRTERAFVSHRGPQSSRLGLASAGIEHGNRRIVGVQRQIQLAIAARGTILTTRSLRHPLAKGKPYQRLNAEQKIMFGMRPLTIMVLENATISEVRDMFLRLQNGTPLNAQEKRNARGSLLRRHVNAIANLPFFEISVKFWW